MYIYLCLIDRVLENVSLYLAQVPFPWKYKTFKTVSQNTLLKHKIIA